MRKRLIFIGLLLLFIQGCASTRPYNNVEAIDFNNTHKGHLITCDVFSECLEEAGEICGAERFVTATRIYYPKIFYPDRSDAQTLFVWCKS
jgi:hypothetical protein